jgi:hypothetical protein
LSHDHGDCTLGCLRENGVAHSACACHDKTTAKLDQVKPVSCLAMAAKGAAQTDDRGKSAIEIQCLFSPDWSRQALQTETTCFLEPQAKSLSPVNTHHISLPCQKATAPATHAINAICGSQYERMTCTDSGRSFRLQQGLADTKSTRQSRQNTVAKCLHHDLSTAPDAQAARHTYALRPPLACPKTNLDARPYEKCRLPDDCSAILQHAILAQKGAENGSVSLHALCRAIEVASVPSSAQPGVKAKCAPRKRDLKRSIVQCLAGAASKQDCVPPSSRKMRKLVP